MRDALKDFASQFYARSSVGNGAMIKDALVAFDAIVNKTCKTVIAHNSNPSVFTPELTDHSPWDHGHVINNLALTNGVHAVNRQLRITVSTHPRSYGCLQRISLFTGHAMVVTRCVHIETSTHQVIDIRLLWRKLKQPTYFVFAHIWSFLSAIFALDVAHFFSHRS